MNYKSELKRVFPEMAQEIDKLANYGAINDQTAKVAIVRKEMESTRYGIEFKERELADRLCVSQRTVKRYK